MAMSVPVWVDAQSTASHVSSRSGSPTPSTASLATTGSFRYVPPNLRTKRNVLRAEVEVARLENDAADAALAAAKHLGPKLPYFDLPFCLNKDQLGFLTARFPRTKFRCTVDTTHDHPIAHTETMIATNVAMRRVPAGHTIIDLFGDPSAADRYNRSQSKSASPKHCVPYCSVMSEKDYIRKLKWGSPTNPDGSVRYVRGPVRADVADIIDPRVNGVSPSFTDKPSAEITYFSKHTLYYLSDLQIARLLRPEDSRMLAVVHRHAGPSGSMFAGEMTFAKKGDVVAPVVEQVNALTGERYVHRDLSWLWDSKTKVKHTLAGSFVWTFHMVTNDTWLIELVGCENMDERLDKRARDVGEREAMDEMNAHSVSPTSFPHPSLVKLPEAEYTMVGGVPLVKIKGSELPEVRLTSPPLFDFLTGVMVGKPRDSDRLNDLFSLARTHIANGTDFPGKRNFDVAARDVAGHVVLAYLAGLEDESKLLLAAESYAPLRRMHHALIDGAALVAGAGTDSYIRTGVSALKRVNGARKQGDLLSGVLTVLE